MITYSKKQSDFLTRPFDHCFEVCEGSPRSGKTFAMTARYALNILRSRDTIHMVVGYSAEQAFRIAMEGDGFGLIHIFAGCSELKHDNTGAHLLVHCPNGDKRIYWKGGGKADSKNVITGLSLGSVYFCEINLLHMEMIQECFRRTYAAKDRALFADLNPPAPNHPVIKEVFEVQDTYWTHWTCKDNPVLTPERLEEIKASCQKSPFLWKRDWLGERVIPEGVVYWMFDSDKHILSKIPEDVQKVKMFVSGDGGTTDATSINAWIVGRQNGTYKLYGVGCWYYDKGQAALSTQAREIVGKFLPYIRDKYKMKEQAVFIDPACKALRLELQKLGIPTQAADNNGHDVRNTTKGIKCGIEMLQSSISEDRFFLIEDEKFGTEPAVKEMGLYCFDEKGNPVDAYNHCLTGDTIVNTTDGDIPIKNLVGKTGTIYCYDEENKRATTARFFDVRMTQDVADIYEIETDDGRTIRCTGDHPILTKEGWKRADELIEGDEIVDISKTPKYQYYDGLKFTRDDKTGYYLNSTIRKRIHRYVWEKEIGPIPDGYHIHHIDGDKSNNHISNLTLMPGQEHLSYHLKEYANEHQDEVIKRLKEKAIPAAAAWHKSEAGKTKAKEQYEIRGHKMYKEVEKTCEYCGKKFVTHSNGNDRFCSNRCKSAWRRASGIDDVPRICEHCGKIFFVNKYEKQKYCSVKCRGLARRGTHYGKREAS